MVAGASVPVLVALAVIALVGGIGITAIGPGGVLPTIGLFALTSMPPAAVAGTAIVTNVPAGIVGSWAYLRSGQLTKPEIRRTALILAGSALVGTPLGVWVNAMVSKQLFGYLLAAIVGAAGLLLWWREARSTKAATAAAAESTAVGTAESATPGPWAIRILGFAISLVSGIIGLGGPMLAVPLLLVMGVPLLEAVAASQVQSIVISGVGAAGYAAQGSIDWAMAAIIGVPLLAGVIIGWKIGTILPVRTLRFVLVAVLLALAPYLAITA